MEVATVLQVPIRFEVFLLFEGDCDFFENKYVREGEVGPAAIEPCQ